MAKKIIITAAMSGSFPMKNQNPSVPYTPKEFAEEAYKIYKAGGAMIHVHGRHPETGVPTPDVKIVTDIYNAIRDRVPELIINVTSSVGGTSTEARLAPIIALKPEMSSLNTNTMNFGMVDRKTGKIGNDGVFTNTFTMLQDFGKTMEAQGTKPEPEIYDIGGLDNWYMISKQGFFTEPYNFNFVWGVAGGFQFRPSTFATIVDMLPPNSNFTTCGVAWQQFPAAMMSTLMGGHVRVGMEDNIRMPNGELAKGSWEQVEAVVKMATFMGREPATPDEARKMMGLKKKA
jgi:3-keto-5-aminohexanoate cleavage enzyme